ncbi:retrovirus-related pol polyprotein from transposon TNT 1-94 [Tanacetum coccineum]
MKLTMISSKSDEANITGYYRRFVKNCAAISNSLTELLKNNSFEWSNSAQIAFDELKVAMINTLVLALPNFQEEFTIKRDTSNEGIRAVLQQKGHPISFLSRSLAPKDKGLSIYEKELWVIVYALEKWKGYLLDKHFKIKTDYFSLKYLMEQRLTTPFQIKWIPKLLGICRAERLEDLKGDDKLSYDSDIKAVNILLLRLPATEKTKQERDLSNMKNLISNAGNNHASGARVINVVGNTRANQPRVIRCYICKGEGHMAKQCAIRKRMKDSEWFKDRMLLAQAQEAGVLQATPNFKADHADAYDSDYDDEATANSIFMENLSLVGSLNDDTIAPQHNPVSVCDSEETLILAEESRLKMLEKQTVVNTKPIDYSKLNKLYEIFVPQTQLSVEQLYWSSIPSPPVTVSKPKVFPKKLPSTSQVLRNLNNARDLLTKFDECIKRRTMLSHHDIEVKEMKDIFEQMEDEVDQCSVAKKSFEIEKKQLLINNDRLLEENIASYVSKFAARIHELLVYVSAFCLFTQSGNEKWALATSHRKNNKPYVDASRTKQTIKTITKEHAVKQNTRKTDNAMLPSTGKVSSINVSGSKPRSNTKNDRVPQPSSRSMKNKVEAHHRRFKSSANKNNHVSDCNANVKYVALSKNSDTICLSCNECLFSANHDACVIQYLKKMQKRKVPKFIKQKVKREWKPPRWIFKIVGLKWIPIGRTFNLVGKLCPLLLLMTRLP